MEKEISSVLINSVSFPIVNALRSQLNWTQYRLLLPIEDNKAILASKYQMYLPSEAEILAQLKKKS